MAEYEHRPSRSLGHEEATKPGDSTPLPKRVAQRSIIGPGAPLPYRDQIQRSFGRHDVSGVRAYLDARAREAALQLGARAFAFGDSVVFATEPTLYTVAHEVAHVVQQRAGRGPSGGIDSSDDALEQHADAVAAAVCAGRSVEALLDRLPGGSSGEATVQRETKTPPPVTAKQFIEGTLGNYSIPSIHVMVAAQLEGIGAVHRAPYFDVLGLAFEQQLLRELALDHRLATFQLDLHGSKQRAWRVEGAAKLETLVAPESLTALVDRSRPMDLADDDGHLHNSGAGSRNPAYERVVALELANAIARRYRDSIQRIFPQFVRCLVEHVSARDATRTPVLSENLVPSHPLDLYVIDSLCRVQDRFDTKALLAKYPALGDVKAVALRDIALQIAPTGPRGTTLFHWVRVTPGDATAEEVAKALFGRTEDAFRLIAMKPFWGFQARDVGAMASNRRLELAAALVHRAQEAPDLAFAVGTKPPPRFVLPAPPETDPMAEMTIGGGEQLALERAKLHATDGPKTERDVASKLGENLRNLEALRSTIAMFGRSAAGVDLAIQHTTARHAAAAGCLADPDASYALAEQQSRALSRVATAMAQAAVPCVAHDPTTRSLALEPVLEVVDLLLGAVDALELPELAVTRVAAAEQLVTELHIRILEIKAHESVRRSQSALDADSDPATNDSHHAKAKAENQLVELARLRLDVGRDPVGTNAAVDKLAPAVEKTWFELGVTERLGALATLWGQLDEMDDFWVAGNLEYSIGQSLKAENRRYYDRFLYSVWLPYRAAETARDSAGMSMARAQFAALINDAGFQAHGKQIREHLERAARIKKWTKVIAGIAIAVAAFGLGQWQFALMAPELGAASAAIGAGLTTTMTQTSLEKLVLDQNTTPGHLIVGALTNIATFAVVGKMMMTASAASLEGEVASAIAGAKPTAKLAEFAKRQVIQIAIAETLGIVSAQTAKLIDGGGALSQAEIEEIFVQQLAGAVGMQIGQLALDAVVAHKLRPVAERCGIDVARLENEHAAIVKLGAEFAAKAKDSHGSPDQAAALELATRASHYLERLEVARERLKDFAKTHPELFTKQDIALLRPANGEAELRTQLEQATALLGLEAYGPNLYRCESAALPAVLRRHREAGGTIENITLDHAAHERTITIKSAQGAELHITERIPDAAEPAVPEKQLRSAHQRAALEALEHGNETATDRQHVAAEIARQVPTGALEVTAVANDAHTLIAIVTPGSGPTGIKTLNDKLLGPQLANRLLAARTKALRTVFESRGMHLVADDYKTIKIVSSKHPNEIAADLKSGLLEIDAAMRGELNRALEDGLMQRSAEVVRSEPNSAARESAQKRLGAIESLRRRLTSEPDFTFGLSFGVAEITGKSHAELDLAERNASAAAALSRVTDLDRPTGTDIGDPRGLIFNADHYAAVVHKAGELRERLKHRTLPLLGRRRVTVDAQGIPDRELASAIRKGELGTLEPADVATRVDLETYIAYANTLDYMSPYKGDETALAAQRGHEAATLIKTLQTNHRFTPKEIEQIRQILRGDWPQSGTASEAEFWNKASALKDRVVLSADIKDLGLDVTLGNARALTRIQKGADVGAMMRGASDAIVGMKRLIIEELRAHYRDELLPAAKREIERQHRADLLPELELERELLFEVGGDDVTISIPRAIEEVGLVPDLVRFFQQRARSRVAVTRTGTELDGGQGHANAMKEAEPAHDALKKYEKLARQLRLVEKRLAGDKRNNAVTLQRQLNSLYTSSDNRGGFIIMTADGKPAVDLDTLENDAAKLISEGERLQ